MARDMLLNAGANVTGKWVRTEPPARRTWPFRIMITGNFQGDAVIIEEGIGGLPGNGNSPYTPQQDTFEAIRVLATISPGGDDVQIDPPVEFMRARTGAFSSGTVSVRLLEAA